MGWAASSCFSIFATRQTDLEGRQGARLRLETPVNHNGPFIEVRIVKGKSMGERKKNGLVLLVVFLLLFHGGAQAKPTGKGNISGMCHFGIGAPYGVKGYDLSLLGVGGYLDWGRYRHSSVPDAIRYFSVLNVSDEAYQDLPQNLPAILARNPGGVWIIGNEPDSEVRYQDHISAETYGARYFALASFIRSYDPTALIGFGPIIQPSQIRITYLQKALDHMVRLAGGSRSTALGLIDVYAIHAFILNEEQLYDSSGRVLSWGAGLPIGYDPSWGAPEVIRIDAYANETWKTHDINIFKNRVIRFRQWMKAQGEQNKPLWITEYGSLFPSTGSSYLYVSDQDSIAFMEQTFEFTLGYRDPNLGYPGDENRLVQHLLWYSLNEDRDKFGGSLFDPLTRARTVVGDRFASYNPPAAIVPPGPVDIFVLPQAPQVLPAGMGSTPGALHYRIVVRASNAISSDRLTNVRVDLYDGSRHLGSVQGSLPRCSGQAEFAFTDFNRVPGEQVRYTAVITLLPNNGGEVNPGNNTITLPAVSMPGVKLLFLPAVRR